jgi:uncharacterized protein YxjI
MSRTEPPPDWYPDPSGRHEKRYWDGSSWTDHVASSGSQSIDALDAPGREQDAEPARIGHQVARHKEASEQRGAPSEEAFEGDGTITGEPILVVNQKPKLIEVNNEYAIYDRGGRQLGAVRQIGQGKLRKLLRVTTSVDQFLTHQLQVVDMEGNVVLQITRPAKLVKSRVVVEDGTGRQVGEVVQDNVFGRIRFSYRSGEDTIGGIQAENWRAWNFSLQDAEGVEVGRVTKTWEGLARNLFTTADNYVLQIHRRLDDPLRSLVVASALCIDTALKQDSRGLS